MVRAKRQSPWWPLLRGVVLFALIAFFVELVPYLPSYGGYVRSIVGVIACIVVGRWAIRWMQAYLARRAADEQRNEAERRQSLRSEDALKRMALKVCPGCERPLAADKDNGSGMPTNFCVHCGMKLYDTCTGCGSRTNAFFTFCAVCGTGRTAATA
ncbi:MAG: zinc ribbon domain-containing protein [Gemmatimonadaceae bacterium]|nr:zinc ribbon domain-containing protein [Gemmatimonadaceae bacterium]